MKKIFYFILLSILPVLAEGQINCDKIIQNINKYFPDELDKALEHVRYLRNCRDSTAEQEADKWTNIIFDEIKRQQEQAERDKQVANSLRKQTQADLKAINEINKKLEKINEELKEKNIKEDSLKNKLARIKKIEAERTLDSLYRVNQTRTVYLKQAKDYIYIMEYDFAFDKCKEVFKTIEVTRNDIIKRQGLAFFFDFYNTIQELGFFYLVTEQWPQIAEIADLINFEGDKNDLDAFAKHLEEIDNENFKKIKNKYYPEMIEVRGGVYLMGCVPYREPYCYRGSVYKTVNSFYIGKTEVTNWQFNLFLKATKQLNIKESEFTLLGDTPAIYVNSIIAVNYCNWLSNQLALNSKYSIKKEILEDDEEETEKTAIEILEQQNGFRLPTYTEWEYCARGGFHHEAFPYAGGPNIDSVAWYLGNAVRPAKVGTKQPNNLGLYDMTGNVKELCHDDIVYHDIRIARGGSFASSYLACQIHEEFFIEAEATENDIGFRVALSK